MDEHQPIDSKTFHEILKQEADEFSAKPWIVRTITHIWNYLWYRVVLNMDMWPRKIKWFFQRLFRGYSDSDLWNLGFVVIDRFYEPIHKFVEHQKEEGMSLPTQFESDPAQWLDILCKIDFSFEHQYRDEHEIGYEPTAKMTDSEKEEFYKKVQEGFDLFGHHLRDLWD